MRTINFESETLPERGRRNLAILEAIRRSGPISKTDISKLIGLNVATVSNYIDEFISKDLVLEKAFDVSCGGRRPLLLDLNADKGVAIGIGLNLLHLVGVVTDINGHLLYSVKRERPELNIQEIVLSIVNVLSELKGFADKEKKTVEGVGVGIAGIVDKNSDSLLWPQREANSGKTEYVSVYLPLKDVVERQFNLPVFVDNDATLACFGEQWLALNSDIRHVLYLFSGVGCGIMIDGQIYRGASGAAGEICLTAPGSLANCEMASSCLFKRTEADLGLVRLAQEQCRQDPEGRGRGILALSTDQVAGIGLAQVFEAAAEHDELARELLENAAKGLGIKLAFLINMLNPQMVIVGGGLEQAGAHFFDCLRSSIDEWAFKETAKAVKIIPSRLGEKAVALGAASLVVRSCFINA